MMPLGRLDASVLTIDAMSVEDASDGALNDDRGQLEGKFPPD